MTKPRKPQVSTRKTVRLTPELAREFMSHGRGCSWQDCTNHCDGDLPPDWVNVLVYWSPQPRPDLTLGQIVMSPFCTRDMTLCAEHARELESLLIPMGRAMDTPLGSA